MEITKSHQEFLNSCFNEFQSAFLNSTTCLPVEYLLKNRTVLPTDGGVYAFIEIINGNVLYIGRTTKLRQRIILQHVLGNESTARLKNYLIDEEDNNLRKDVREGKRKRKLLVNKLKQWESYLIENCKVVWITDSEIQNLAGAAHNPTNAHRYRGVLENYFTGILFPHYGIYKEH